MVLAAAATEPPKVFLGYQQRLMSSVSHHAVVVVEKSRRTGYSWAAAAIAMLTASSTKKAGGSDVFYMGYNLEMAREFIDYVGDWAKQISPAAVQVEEFIFKDPDNPDREIKAFRIDFASGFKVVALPSVPRALRGMQGLVIIDEAAFHDDLEELLKAAFALLIWGGKVLIISTHDGDQNKFNVLVQDIRGGRKPYHLERCTFDDALADGLYRRICYTKGKEWSPEAEAAWREEIIAFYGDAADEELFCIPQPSSGSAISTPLIEARMDKAVPVIRLTLPDTFVHMAEHLREAEIRDWCERELKPHLAKLDHNARHALGGDFGRSGDRSVFWPLSIGRDLVRRTPFTVELQNVPFRAQEQILFYIIDRLPRFDAGKLDARGNGQYLAEVAAQRYGSKIEQVMLSEAWYRENMPVLKTLIEDAEIILPHDGDVLSDFRALKYVRGVIRIIEKNDGEAGKRHGDSAIAAALAAAAARADPVVYEYKAVNPQADSANSSSPAGDRDDDDDRYAHLPQLRGQL